MVIKKNIGYIIVGAIVVLYGAFFITRYVQCNDRGIYSHRVCACKGFGNSMEHCIARAARRMEHRIGHMLD